MRGLPLSKLPVQSISFHWVICTASQALALWPWKVPTPELDLQTAPVLSCCSSVWSHSQALPILSAWHKNGGSCDVKEALRQAICCQQHSPNTPLTVPLVGWPRWHNPGV